MYRIDAGTWAVTRVLQDWEFVRPNGIAFSNDGTKVFITDSGYFLGAGPPVPSNPATVIRFDVVEQGKDAVDGQSIYRSQNTRVPDGIQVDTLDRLYLGDGAFLTIIDEHGTYIGKVNSPTTTMVFTDEGLMLFGETQIALISGINATSDNLAARATFLIN